LDFVATPSSFTRDSWPADPSCLAAPSCFTEESCSDSCFAKAYFVEITSPATSLATSLAISLAKSLAASQAGQRSLVEAS